MFLRTGAFFSSILSEFLKNLVALQFVLAFILFWDIAVILVVADAMLSAMLIFGIIKNKFSVR